jgi:hypothetical protein
MPKERDKKYFRVKENGIKVNRENYLSRNFIILLYSYCYTSDITLRCGGREKETTEVLLGNHFGSYYCLASGRRMV